MLDQDLPESLDSCSGVRSSRNSLNRTNPKPHLNHVRLCLQLKNSTVLGEVPMHRNMYLEPMFPLIHMKHRQLTSTPSPQFVMRPGDPQHESWREMQMAYNKYLYASEELDVARSK